MHLVPEAGKLLRNLGAFAHKQLMFPVAYFLLCYFLLCAALLD